MHDEGGGLAVFGRDVDLAFLHGVGSFCSVVSMRAADLRIYDCKETLR
jgi:hypothetical protein